MKLSSPKTNQARGLRISPNLGDQLQIALERFVQRG
jgi:hypothetical protein